MAKIIEPKVVIEPPKLQVAIVKDAVRNYLETLSLVAHHADSENIKMLEFDLRVWKALLRYNVKIEMTKEEFDNFSATNKIDLPIYVNDK